MFPARVAVGASPPLWGRERSPGTEATRSGHAVRPATRSGHAVRPRGQATLRPQSLAKSQREVAAKSSTCPVKRFSQIGGTDRAVGRNCNLWSESVFCMTPEHIEFYRTSTSPSEVSKSVCSAIVHSLILLIFYLFEQ